MLVECGHAVILHANRSGSKVRENTGNATNNKWTSTDDLEQCDEAFTQSYIRAGDQRLYEQNRADKQACRSGWWNKKKFCTTG